MPGAAWRRNCGPTWIMSSTWPRIPKSHRGVRRRGWSKRSPCRSRRVRRALQQRAALAKVLFCLTDIPIDSPSAWQPAATTEAAATDDLSEKHEKSAIRIVGLAHGGSGAGPRGGGGWSRSRNEMRRRMRSGPRSVRGGPCKFWKEVRFRMLPCPHASRWRPEKEYDGAATRAVEAIVGKPGGMTGRWSDVEAFEKRLAELAAEDHTGSTERNWKR